MEFVELLCASNKIDRDIGEQKLKNIKLTEEEAKLMNDWIIKKSENLPQWEDIFGALTLSRILVENLHPTILEALNLYNFLIENMSDYYEHWEYRVRIVAGRLMGSLCQIKGSDVFNMFLPIIKKGIQENLDRDPLIPNLECEESRKELELAVDRNPNLSKSSLQIFHDTAGWKNLETWMKSLQLIICGFGMEKFAEYDDPEILLLIFSAVTHTNRFVRETGYELLGTLIESHGFRKQIISVNGESVSAYIRIAKQLACGLEDNWSQVRMAASKSIRLFFSFPPPNGMSYSDFFPVLLPPMCLNRFYVAEGVRLYSQETWSKVTKGRGRDLLTGILHETVKYFASQTEADNHAIREAACFALAEAGTKLPAEKLRPHISELLLALEKCFNDDSWPVRDAACIALGNFISVFPEETREAGYKDLMFDKYLLNLTDSIPSVREGAAASIAKILKTDKDSSLDQSYLEFIKKQLQEVSSQLPDSKGASSDRVSRSSGPGSVSVHTYSSAHDPRHTDQTMYSCGSLAPKATKSGSCHGHFQRLAEPWERADGAIRLIGELAIAAPHKLPDSLIEDMVAASFFSQYTHHAYLLETVCHTIQQLCTGLSKARFKKSLDLVLPILGLAINTGTPLTVAAAEDCFQTFVQKIDHSLLRGRIDSHIDSSLVSRLLPLFP